MQPIGNHMGVQNRFSRFLSLLLESGYINAGCECEGRGTINTLKANEEASSSPLSPVRTHPASPAYEQLFLFTPRSPRHGFCHLFPVCVLLWLLLLHSKLSRNTETDYNMYFTVSHGFYSSGIQAVLTWVILLFLLAFFAVHKWFRVIRGLVWRKQDHCAHMSDASGMTGKWGSPGTDAWTPFMSHPQHGGYRLCGLLTWALAFLGISVAEEQDWNRLAFYDLTLKVTSIISTTVYWSKLSKRAIQIPGEASKSSPPDGRTLLYIQQQ